MRALAAIVLAVLSLQAAAVDASNRYRSPRNPERKIRQTTELIVLHTTEAPARSSLNKVSERGECHFCVTEEGQIYRIVDRDREAFHAGRSMWNGKEDVDKFSIGIECVGYHDKEMSIVQLNAIRDLVKDLKSMYNLTDDKVVCHSHVAYGAPNKWQKKKHRGRKRCGMLFAMPSVRRVLELKARPAVDMDVRKRRLVVGDPYLEKVLYGRTDTMVAAYQGVKPRPAVVAPAKPVVSPPQKAPPQKAQAQRQPPQKPAPARAATAP
ncbi:MAG: N-acetylmuramoyl-L-alanine amidase, partial [Kiritimatiellae bacterium]|nr:N-acetylmuramoyl-L-alanine amidase [Kiritimatiellia bacterium]